MKPRTLIVVPHADDETFALHGYIQRFKYTEKILVLVLSCATEHHSKIEYARYDACRDILTDMGVGYSIYKYSACNLFKDRDSILDTVKLELTNFKPCKMLIPSANDLHLDHKLVNELCKIATRPNRQTLVNEVCEYSVPESEQFGVTYFDTVLELTESEHKLKIEACEKYTTEYIPKAIYSTPHIEQLKTIFRRL